MSHCEPYILLGMPHELMWHVMLCDMSHITFYKIWFEVAKLPPQTQSPPPPLGGELPSRGHPRGWLAKAGHPARAQRRAAALPLGHRGRQPTPAAGGHGCRLRLHGRQIWCPAIHRRRIPDSPDPSLRIIPRPTLVRDLPPGPPAMFSSKVKM
jgi:hypothetical protein